MCVQLDGRSYLRAGTPGGTRIETGKSPLPNGRGPEPYGPGAPRTGVLGILLELRGDDMRTGHRLTSRVTGMTPGHAIMHNRVTG